MITSLEIKNYKCFKEITLPNLSRINLFSGSNSVGKSAILEAIWLNNGYYNPHVEFQTYTFRGFTTFQKDNLMKDLFHNFTYSNKIILICKGETDIYCRSHTIESFDLESFSTDNGKDGTSFDSTLRNQKGIKTTTNIKNHDSESTQLYFKGDELVAQKARELIANSIYVQSKGSDFNEEEFDAYTLLSEEGKKKLLVTALQEFDPYFEGIEIGSKGGKKYFQIKVSYLQQAIPMNFLGNGIVHLMHCILAIIRAKSGSVMVDEIENGIYHENLGIIWTQLHKLAEKFNVQIFASTHSYECIREAHNALKGKDALKVFRLQRSDSDIEAIEYNEESLGASLKFNMEIR